LVLTSFEWDKPNKSETFKGVDVSFDYDEIKSREEAGSHWATYSDLFMVLSLVFLLLYVVSSVRTGTSNIKSNAEYMAVVRDKQALEQELAVYENQKEGYLKQANVKEIKAYDELMDKLSLLQEEAKQEKEDLRKAAAENEQKEKALNKYQRLVRSIINSNMVASRNLDKRAKTIKKRNKTIDEQKEEIQGLEKTVVQKEKQIKRDNAKIKNLNASLSNKVKELRQSFKARKISKKKMQQQIAALKSKNQKKIQKLKQANAQASQVIAQNKAKIKQVSAQLAQAEQTIATQQSDLEKLYQEQEQTFEKMVRMQSDFDKQMQREKAEFENKLAKQKLSAAQKEARQQEFLQKAQAKQDALSKQISQMESQVQGIQSQLDQTRNAQAQAEAQSQALAAKNKNLTGQKAELSKELKRMQDIANARKKLVSEMKANLAKAGLKAKVDGKSGEVVIEFGEEYFDTGQASMKPGMEKVLKKFMPAYSKSLFSNPETAEKIKSVEIVGYASPTYQGRYVDPKSLNAKDKEAVNYNLSLSFNRAKSIFNYIFDKDKMNYQHQQRIYNMTKVTGRSFLAEGADQRVMANMSQKEYCKKYDCKKSQRVVIKFNMKN
jgi:myosin heavy subunit